MDDNADLSNVFSSGKPISQVGDVHYKAASLDVSGIPKESLPNRVLIMVLTFLVTSGMPHGKPSTKPVTTPIHAGVW